MPLLDVPYPSSSLRITVFSRLVMVPLLAIGLFDTVCSNAEIHGRVVDASAAPISGVVLTLEKNGDSATTGADGTFSLKAGGTPGDVVLATKAGFLDDRRTLDQPEVPFNLRLIPCAATVTDVDGNVYQAVRLGKQVWTVSNLRTTRFNDGTTIPFDAATAAWKDNTTPMYCQPKDVTDPKVLRRFGLLYNFYAVDTGKLAPPGWHVPTGKEWAEFEAYLIGQGFNWDGSTVGDKIGKAISARTDWNLSSVEGAIGNDLSKNNATGFSAYGTGFRHESGIYDAPGRYTGWWTSTASSSDHAGMIDLHFNQADWSNKHHYRSACGYPVRLIRD